MLSLLAIRKRPGSAVFYGLIKTLEGSLHWPSPPHSSIYQLYSISPLYGPLSDYSLMLTLKSSPPTSSSSSFFIPILDLKSRLPTTFFFYLIFSLSAPSCSSVFLPSIQTLPFLTLVHQVFTPFPQLSMFSSPHRCKPSSII